MSSSKFYLSTEEIHAQIAAWPDVVEHQTVGDYLVTYHHSPDPEGPREWLNLGTMACYHPRYQLGDHDEAFAQQVVTALRERGVRCVARWLRAFHGATVVLPLWLYDHSGLSMSTSRSPFDPGGWDSSLVGLIFDTPAAREATGVALADVERVLAGEVDTYSMYLAGDVWGYVVWDAAGEQVDSCWGFYGWDEVVREGAESALYLAQHAGEAAS